MSETSRTPGGSNAPLHHLRGRSRPSLAGVNVASCRFCTAGGAAALSFNPSSLTGFSLTQSQPREASLDLLERAKAGGRQALEALIARYLPRLRRWAHGRLPAWSRDLAETQDLVQETVFSAFKQIERFEVRGEGALQAYLRQALINRIRAEIRRVGRRPQ